jgi:hypothetical protein
MLGGHFGNQFAQVRHHGAKRIPVFGYRAAGGYLLAS